MQEATYTHPNRPSKLYDEMLAAFPQLGTAPMESNELLQISGDGAIVWLRFPDDLLEPDVAAVVAAHDPSTPGGTEVLADAEVANERTLDDRLELQLSNLRVAIDAMTANPPTLFAGLSNQERVFLRRLARNQADLIKLRLRDFESSD